MNSTVVIQLENDRWAGQRGAALIMTLLISTLLLIAGGALILTTSMTAGLAVDSTAEQQAYYSAEAGVNASLNVLRRNIQSNPAGTNATFANFLNNPTLSTWLNYNGTINGTPVVTLNNTPAMGYTVSVSAMPQPNRLRVQVTGYGPKASVKRMETVVDRHAFDFTAIATILVRGNDDNASTIINFNIGNSNAKTYSGYDNAIPANALPTFGVTHANDNTLVTNEINSAKPNTISAVQNVKTFTNAELAPFLQTADNARALLTDMHAQAAASGRYYTSTPASYGTESNPQLTFVDGNCDLSDGAGLLIVTGTLSVQGNVGFKGLILVLGDGVFTRGGGGNGDTLGAIVVARFARSWPSSENGDPHPFLSATYNMNGGGNSLTGYDSSWVENALSSGVPRTLAIREY